MARPGGLPMPIDTALLHAELSRLRKGRAMHDPDLQARVGTQTKAAFGIAPADKNPVIRRKMTEGVKRLLRNKPEVVVPVLGALGLLPQIDHRLLKDREDVLAHELKCGVRTVRRRIDEGLKLLVDAIGTGDHAAQLSDVPRDDGFVVRTIWATMNLQSAGPQLRERRLIVVTADRLNAIVGRFSVPLAGPEVDQSQLEVRAESGGSVTRLDRRSAVDFEFIVSLPRPLLLGDTHEYTLVYSLPVGQPMRPHYVVQPLVPCQRFELIVRFDPLRVPSGIWLIDGLLPRSVDQPADAERLRPNPRGSLKRTFTELRQGLAYGVRWDPV